MTSNKSEEVLFDAEEIREKELKAEFFRKLDLDIEQVDEDNLVEEIIDGFVEVYEDQSSISNPLRTAELIDVANTAAALLCTRHPFTVKYLIPLEAYERELVPALERLLKHIETIMVHNKPCILGGLAAYLQKDGDVVEKDMRLMSSLQLLFGEEVAEKIWDTDVFTYNEDTRKKDPQKIAEAFRLVKQGLEEITKSMLDKPDTWMMNMKNAAKEAVENLAYPMEKASEYEWGVVEVMILGIKKKCKSVLEEREKKHRLREEELEQAKKARLT